MLPLSGHHSRRPSGCFRSTGLPSGLPSSSMAGYGTILRATAGMSIGERSWGIVQKTRRRKMERRHLLR